MMNKAMQTEISQKSIAYWGRWNEWTQAHQWEEPDLLEMELGLADDKYMAQVKARVEHHPNHSVYENMIDMMLDAEQTKDWTCNKDTKCLENGIVELTGELSSQWDWTHPDRFGCGRGYDYGDGDPKVAMGFSQDEILETFTCRVEGWDYCLLRGY